jgi:hypothetical protein
MKVDIWPRLLNLAIPGNAELMPSLLSTESGELDVVIFAEAFSHPGEGSVHLFKFIERGCDGLHDS